MDDRGETVNLMQPMKVGQDSPRLAALNDLAVELTAKASAFRSTLPPGIREALANLVRAMNCYYSNLIEGHDTHPIDIERAIANDFSADPKQRDSQLEAKAHIEVQEWIDAGGLAGRATSIDGLRETHARFCSSLPEDLLQVKIEDTGEVLSLVPGAWRKRHVQVGRHVAVSPGAIPRFMEHFEWTYGRLGLCGDNYDGRFGDNYDGR
jgi:Fic family protein